MAGREREVRLTILGEDKGASAALRKVDDAAGKLGPSGKIAEKAVASVNGRLDELGPAGNVAKGALDKIGAGAMSTGAMLGTALAGGAVLGGAALVALAVDGIGAMVDLAGEVRNFQRATGLGAEDASRMVSVLDDMGISSDVGASSMFKLAKNVADGGEKLGLYGVEVAKTKDGNTDLMGTLLNVADAYTKTQDPARRAELVTAAFGKAGQNLIPILEKGRDGIQQMFDAVKRGEIMSQKQIDQTREFELAVDDVQDSFRSLQIRGASVLLPYVTSLAEAGTATLDFIDKVGETKGGGIAGALLGIVASGTPAGSVLKFLQENFGGAGKEAEAAAAKFDLQVVALEQLGVQVSDAEMATGELTEETKKAAAEAQKYRDKIEQMAGSVAAGYGLMSGKAFELTDKQRDLARGMDTAKTSADQLKQGLDLLIGVHVTAQQASIRWEEAIDSTTQTLGENKRTLDITTEAGRQNEGALINMITAALGHVDALKREGASSERVTAAYGDHVQALRNVMTQAGYSKQEIEALLNRYGLLAAAPDINKTVTTYHREVYEQIAVGFGVPGRYRATGGMLNTAAAGAVVGFKTRGPTLVGEGNPNYPEYVIATDPAYRDRNVKLLAAAASAMGGGGMAAGGTGGSWSGGGDLHVHIHAGTLVGPNAAHELAQMVRNELVRYGKRVNGLGLG